ncbi:SURF1 family protein [Massilia sp. YIM B02763]|uniref:SURF1 family protein n=1 Tax=Massilia sp. YIM B02763 TaxID=3050130 RepID=UPI0025B64409|nr:SURF1 family protein [Massilia sp. YIM B02763]MDN4053271.1 SURF1 family protein [Massilia sp. YIM B02763]
MRLRFRFSIVPFIATVALVVLGIVLGNWQARRAEEKTALQAHLLERGSAPPLRLGHVAIDPAAVEYRRVVATGRFVRDWPVYLDNRPLGGHEGRSGFVLLMPFKIAAADNTYVLVARGWFPRDPGAHDRIPALPVPEGEQTIEGIAVPRPARVMQLGTAPPLAPHAIVQNLEVADVARASGLAMLPFLVEQTGNPAYAPDGLVRQWPAPALDVDRHRGYAFQWYALAAMACVFFVMTGFRRGRQTAG